ncbi:MAG: hypothetical protein HP496_12535 [Nitrospira sp.]|nr:hypothetical protein [Nitrospira sp.]
MKKHLVSMFLVGLMAGTLSACASFAETPGEHFRKVMKEMEDLCVSKKLIATDSRCILPRMKPADPLTTEEGRIKIPNPVPVDSGYKPGMTPAQYFDHLCKTEAGEFIYKTVENVDGLYMMRPREKATDYELEHLYAMEDPYGQVVGEDTLPQDSYVQPAMGKYEFLEVPLSGVREPIETLAKYKRYYRDDHAHPGKEYQTVINGKSVFVPYVVAEERVSDIKSRYGFTWRGVPRPYDREFGIAGGELIVLDLKSHEVVAVRRGFIQSGWMKNLAGIWWLKGRVCRAPEAKREHLFIKEILEPVNLTAPSKEK